MNDTPEQNKTPRKNSFLQKLVATIVTILIALIIIILVATSGDGGDNSGSDFFYINEQVTVGNLAFTVTKVEDTQQIGSSFLGATTDANFTLVYISVKNAGNREINLKSSNFYLYRGSARYEISSNGIYADNGFWLIETISPGITKSFVLVFETPDKSIESNYQLEVHSSSSSYKKINLKNK